MLDLRQLETFLAVIASGSFHKAGRRLGLAQPTVSQHVRKLEEAVRATLVERGPLGCRPTAAARAIIPYAESLLRVAGRALEAVRRDRLVVGASGNIGVYLAPGLVKRFETAADGVPVELAIAPNPEIAERLDRAELDVALLEWWDGRAGYDAAVWKDEPIVAIVAPGHPWARGASVTGEELKHAELLGGETGTGTGRLLREALGGAGRVGRQLGSTEAVKRAVRAGLGVSVVLAATVSDEVAAGTLLALPIAAPVPLRKRLWAVHRSHAPSTSSDRRFVQSIRNGVGVRSGG